MAIDQHRYPPPTTSSIAHAGTYRRRMAVSLERMFENALDWEHLPHLHRSSFSTVECLDAGDWGWRARVRASAARGANASLIELRLDQDLHRWITRTLEGRGAGNEVWTHAFEFGPSEIEVVVDFFTPGVADENRERVGTGFIDLYQKLYDEDEWMMRLRQRRLEDAQRQLALASERLPLGALAELIPTLPRCVNFNGRRLRLAEVNGEIHVFDTLCPHALGPLDTAPIVQGIVECPWHGHRFDIVTSRCVSRDKPGFSDGQLRLRPAPSVEIDHERTVWLVDERAAR